MPSYRKTKTPGVYVRHEQAARARRPRTQPGAGARPRSAAAAGIPSPGFPNGARA
jgi:hypothetical protein